MFELVAHHVLERLPSTITVDHHHFGNGRACPRQELFELPPCIVTRQPVDVHLHHRAMLFGNQWFFASSLPNVPALARFCRARHRFFPASCLIGHNKLDGNVMKSGNLYGIIATQRHKPRVLNLFPNQVKIADMPTAGVVS